MMGKSSMFVIPNQMLIMCRPDWGDIWDKSEERKARTKEIEDMVNERKNSGDKAKSEDGREYAMSFVRIELVVVLLLLTCLSTHN
jgi:hypothetical protein